MLLTGKTVGMMVGPLFEDLEFWSVYMRIREEGADIRVIASEAGTSYVSKHGGLTASADTASKEARSDDLLALLVPGGFAPDKMRRDPDLLRLVREMDSEGGRKRGNSLRPQMHRVARNPRRHDKRRWQLGRRGRVPRR